VISKKYRLTEREVKKVLHKWKPFFSYGIVLNSCKNKCWYNRFAIVLWWKSVNCNVERNYFRRKFYDIVSSYDFKNQWTDFVFVVKKKTKFDKKNLESILWFEKDLMFLLGKI
jgi:ribonuclease P protein component